MRSPGSLRRSAFLAAVLCVAVHGGCASSDVQVRIDSEPEGATVYLDGERVGAAGGTFTLRYGSDPLQQICVQLRKPGCKPVEESWELDEVPQPGRDGTRVKVFSLEPIQ